MLNPNIDEDRIKDLVYDLTKTELLSFKNVIIKLLEVINNPLSTILEFQKIIEIDPTLTYSVLKKANTVHYKPENNITSIVQAVMWLGINNIKDIVLNKKISNLFIGEINNINGYSRSKLWKHSLAVAILSKLIYRKELCKPGNIMYTIGLIHDIGIIIEDQFLNNDFIKVLNTNNLSLLESEFSIFGFNHQQLAYYFGQYWGLPNELNNIILNHHSPLDTNDEYKERSCVLYICEYICDIHNYKFSNFTDTNSDTYNKCLEYLNIKDISIDELVKELDDEINKMECEGLL